MDKTLTIGHTQRSKWRNKNLLLSSSFKVPRGWDHKTSTLAKNDATNQRAYEREHKQFVNFIPQILQNRIETKWMYSPY